MRAAAAAMATTIGPTRDDNDVPSRCRSGNQPADAQVTQNTAILFKIFTVSL